jgi:hypothetical protein
MRLLIQHGAVAEDHSEASITAIGYEKRREFEYPGGTGSQLVCNIS